MTDQTSEYFWWGGSGENPVTVCEARYATSTNRFFDAEHLFLILDSRSVIPAIFR